MAKKQSDSTSARKVRPTILESITTAAMQEVAHLSTDEILSRGELVLHKITIFERNIAELAAKLSAAKSELSASCAQLHAYNHTVFKRGIRD